jgi:hypothetical protein
MTGGNQSGEGQMTSPETSQGDVVMTHNSNHVPAQTSQFNEFVGGALTTVVLVAFAFVSIVSLVSFVHI